MKKIFYSIIASCLLFSSCSDFLELIPEDFSTPKNWYSTENELESSLQAIYESLFTVYRADLSQTIAGGTDVDFLRTDYTFEDAPCYYNHTTSSNSVEVVWTHLYKGIDNANMFIDNADNALANGVSKEVVDAYKAEALFFRGYFHLILAQYWGDVPLKTKTTESLDDCYAEFATREEVFTQVLADLENSVEDLRPITEWGFGGRVSQSAAKGMLVRAYMHAAGLLNKPEYYQNARDWAADLMDDGIHSLNPSFEGIFRNYGQDLYDIKESIFEVESAGYNPSASYTSALAGAWNCEFTFKSSGTASSPINDSEDPTYSVGEGRARVVSPPTYFDLFENGDTRRDWTLAGWFYKVEDGVGVRNYFFDEFKFRHIAKFRRIYENPASYYRWGSGGNYPILRYADVLLMFAEAENEVNGGPTDAAYAALNEVHQRAYKGGVLEGLKADVAGLDYDSFKEYIIDERGREFCAEGLRKLDLFRWGKSVFFEKMEEAGKFIVSIPAKDPVTGLANPAINQSGSGMSTDANVLATSYKNIYENANWEKYMLLPIPIKEVTTNKALSSTYNNPGW